MPCVLNVHGNFIYEKRHKTSKWRKTLKTLKIKKYYTDRFNLEFESKTLRLILGSRGRKAARCKLPHWVDFLESHSKAKQPVNLLV